MLKLMYITNVPKFALIAEKNGVDRIWIDLETLNKNERQKNIDSVKSKHCISDIYKISPLLTTAEMLVRINPINPTSKTEIDSVVAAGAKIIMLPMWKTVDEVKKFIAYVNGRVKTLLLLETAEAVECIDEVLALGGFDEIHIGLNDLHLSYGLNFMFELLTDGTVEMLCNKFKHYDIPYGFGGIAGLGCGMLPAEKIIMEHYRLGSTRAILSRSFCNTKKDKDVNERFVSGMTQIRNFEKTISSYSSEQFETNRKETCAIVADIVNKIKTKALEA